MKYLGILLICIVVYSVPQWVPQADGTWFYAVQGMWSMLAIFLILSFDTGRLALTISAIEFTAILHHLMACFGYLTPNDFFYQHYGVILDGINTVEALALAIGLPWHGIFDRLQFLRRDNNPDGTAGYYSVQNTTILPIQERSMQ